ncbi:MAG TPA: EamA family transporter [Candidatus Binatia bacterium]|nr:EamA family transporter [Candidatus Binatia bacterium]
MTPLAVGLVLISALLHAGWNLFGKGSADKSAFFFAQGLVTLGLCGPFAAVVWSSQHINALGWLCIALSAAAHAGYALFLVKAYEVGDLSVAYPLSRSAPALVLIWEITIGRQRLSVWGIAGALLAVAGALLVQWPLLRQRGVRGVLRADVTRYALITACFIAAFTIVDKLGVSQVHPLIFLLLILAGEFPVFAIRMGAAIGTRLRLEWRRTWRTIVITAVVGPFSYLLILWALRAAPATYVLSLRQTSIVFGVILGRFVLGESGTRYPLYGALAITLAGVLISLGG